jgi:predicted nucleic acid-binding protein
LSAVLIDTNVLLRRTQPSHEHFDLAVAAVARLVEGGDDVCWTPQVAAEFWCVATRPVANNGLGFSTAEAAREIAKLERSLTLLPDLPAIYSEWLRLVTVHDVKGVRVHDARLVASMNVHGVRNILTFNSADFARYPVTILAPSNV